MDNFTIYALALTHIAAFIGGLIASRKTAEDALERARRSDESMRRAMDEKRDAEDYARFLGNILDKKTGEKWL